MVQHADIDHTGLTGVGGVATDPIWDTAGDIAVGSGENTAAKLAIGNAGGHVSRINGTVQWDSRTSMPTAATGDRVYRSDLRMEFFYDGTRWLCICPHVQEAVPDGDIPMSASGSARAVHPGQGLGLDIWVEKYWALTNVLTTNDGSKYWTIQLGALTTLSTVSNTPTTDVMESQTVDTTRALASFPVMYYTITKVSTAGNLYAAIGMSYRFIGT